MKAFQRVRGTRDYLPPESYKIAFILDKAREVFERHGFKRIETPVIEPVSLFERSTGTSTDIVQKEMYVFEDKGGRKLALRPEGTPGAVRAFIQEGVYAKGKLTKWYYAGPMFRYERPQAGRYRQFWQVGVEAFGVSSPTMDAEIIAVACELVGALGIEKTAVAINSVGCPKCRPAYREALIDFFRGKIDQMCADCKRRINQNPLRILDCKNEKDREIISQAPDIREFLCEDCRKHLAETERLLGLWRIKFFEDPRLVRGLDYYTRTVFEVFSEGLGRDLALVGGGRYDNLVKELGGPDVPATGFAAGVERLASLIPEERVKVPAPEVFVAVVGSGKPFEEAWRLYGRLLRAGIRAEFEHWGRSLKAQLGYASKMGVRFVIIVAEEEVKEGKVAVKNMEEGSQVAVDIGGAEKYLLSALCGGDCLEV